MSSTLLSFHLVNGRLWRKTNRLYGGIFQRLFDIEFMNCFIHFYSANPFSNCHQTTYMKCVCHLNYLKYSTIAMAGMVWVSPRALCIELQSLLSGNKRIIFNPTMIFRGRTFRWGRLNKAHMINSWWLYRKSERNKKAKYHTVICNF